jgi:hypothetical protein
LYIAASVFTIASTLAADDPWLNLQRVTHDRSYVILMHDHSCVAGKIERTDVQSAIFRVGSSDRVISRSEVLMVCESLHLSGIACAPTDAIFSGRSSWKDVISILPARHEYVEGETKAGLRFTQSGRYHDSLIVGTGNVNKTDAKFVSYLRWKPLSDGQEDLRERGMGFLLPTIWHNLVSSSGRLTVPLYDASQPEDNSEITCK